MKTIRQVITRAFMLTMLLIGTFAKAQDGTETLPLYPLIPDQSRIPEEARELVRTRLDQAITTNGMGGMASLTNRFVLVPKVNVLQKNVIGSAPVMTQLSIEVNLTVADMGTKRTIANLPVALNGAGVTEDKAYIMAFQNMDVESGKVADFMKTSRKKILDFYNANCSRIIQQAQTSINRNEPEEALEQLLAVPFEAKGCFDKAQALIPKAFRQYQLKQCDVFMQKAEAALAAGNEEEAAQAIAMVPSYSVCGKRADKVIAKLNKQWLLKYNNEFKLRAMRIDAAKWVAASLLESARRFYPIYVWPGVMQPFTQQQTSFLQ